MCGIVACAGAEDAAKVLLHGLTVLQNRGYDSAGMATRSSSSERSAARVNVDSTNPALDSSASSMSSFPIGSSESESESRSRGAITVTKFASTGKSTANSLARLIASAGEHGAASSGIAHTRWATHGGCTDANAHPHQDMRHRISLVHNGTITNFTQLRQELEGEGVVFRSETDTEVIAQLLGLHMEDGIPLRRAVDRTLKRLQGTFALCIMTVDNDDIIVARRGMPIVIGLAEGSTYVASETSAFNAFARRYISVREGEVLTITANGTREKVEVSEPSRVQVAPAMNIALTPAPFEHWTLREIHEQNDAVRGAIGGGCRVGDKVALGGLEGEGQKEMLAAVHHLVVVACGSSHYAANYGARLMRALYAFDTVQSVDAAEIDMGMFPPSRAGVLAISQSGETKDTHRALTAAMDDGVTGFSIINSVNSLIARTTGCGVYLNAGREHAVASTKAFTSQVVVLGLMAAWFAQIREEAAEHTSPQRAARAAVRRHSLAKSLRELPAKFGEALSARSQCFKVAQELRDHTSCFVLGKGFGEPIAMEGALKIKEISYIHAAGYSGGALKHGPFALIHGPGAAAVSSTGGPNTTLRTGTPVILIVLDDEHKDHMRTAAHEVRARGAYTVVITTNPAFAEGVSDECILIPECGMMTALLAVVPLQLLAYELAIAKGINPDVPRNLAKAVTVD